MDEVEGGYVNWDCRSGDMISFQGHDHYVRDTYPCSVRLESATEHSDVLGRRFHISYPELNVEKAYYVARLIPVRPPEGHPLMKREAEWAANKLAKAGVN